MSAMNRITQLETLGYGQFFEDDRLKLGTSIDRLARVVAEHRGAYEVIGFGGECRATVSGKLMLTAQRRDDYPAVGDWVVVRDSSEGAIIIENVLQRRTVLRKKYGGRDEAQLIAANVDVVFIVESVDRDYNVNRFERYLVLAREGDVQPVIVLNKSDLLSEAELAKRIDQLHERFRDVDILHTSTLTMEGLKGLSGFIQKGVTYCFLGSSGVGKSSLINKLLNQDDIETKDIGVKTGRGRHTTTAREIYLTSQGGIIIDNPGSREVGVVDSSAGAKEVFADIEKLSQNCKFKDCKHINEHGCAVLKALASGELDASRYENYMRIQKEIEHYEMNSYDRRQKDRKFGKFIKQAKADREKYNSW